MFIEHQFGVEAVEFIRSELSRFGGLRSFLRERHLEQGRIFAYMPFHLDEEYLARFDGSILDSHGGWPAVDHEYLEREIEFIREYLMSSERHIGLIQADYFRSNRGEIRLAPEERMVLYRRNDGSPPEGHPIEGWIVIDQRDCTPEEILLALKRGQWLREVGVLTSLPEDIAKIGKLQEFTTEQMKALAKNADHIIYNAYDAEFLLFWSPDKNSPERPQR